MTFKKWVEKIQTAGYNGVRTVYASKATFINVMYEVKGLKVLKLT